MQAAHGPEALGGVDGAHRKGRRSPGQDFCYSDGSSGLGSHGRRPAQESDRVCRHGRAWPSIGGRGEEVDLMLHLVWGKWTGLAVR